MHEMSILTNEVDTVLVYAAENNASWVIEVSLVVGDLRDVVDELMESCFQFLSRGTIAEGSPNHGKGASEAAMRGLPAGFWHRYMGMEAGCVPRLRQQPSQGEVGSRVPHHRLYCCRIGAADLMPTVLALVPGRWIPKFERLVLGISVKTQLSDFSRFSRR